MIYPFSFLSPLLKQIKRNLTFFSCAYQRKINVFSPSSPSSISQMTTFSSFTNFTKQIFLNLSHSFFLSSFPLHFWILAFSNGSFFRCFVELHFFFLFLLLFASTFIYPLSLPSCPPKLKFRVGCGRVIEIKRAKKTHSEMVFF